MFVCINDRLPNTFSKPPYTVRNAQNGIKVMYLYIDINIGIKICVKRRPLRYFSY